jgi:endogenous inhibitor of DNA gyrase (YacG/DUF329 family)
MNKICPTCGTVVTVEGKTTLYYWCSNCQKAVDPITEELTLANYKEPLPKEVSN